MTKRKKKEPPPDMFCDRGAPCEWDRFHSHTGMGNEHLHRLRLCDVHRARFEEGRTCAR
jgi:hypothetical protein